MFLKYKQTQPVCTQNEHIMRCTWDSFSHSWNQTSQKQTVNVPIVFLIIVQYIIVQ